MVKREKRPAMTVAGTPPKASSRASGLQRSGETSGTSLVFYPLRRYPDRQVPHAFEECVGVLTCDFFESRISLTPIQPLPLLGTNPRQAAYPTILC